MVFVSSQANISFAISAFLEMDPNEFKWVQKILSVCQDKLECIKNVNIQTKSAKNKS